MKLFNTITENWFTLLQSIGIVGSLVFSATSIREDTRSRRAETFLRIAAEHRKIWSDFYRNPELKRVSNPDADLKTSPVTTEERIFVQAVILHLNAVFQANRLGSLIEPEGVRRDIRNFFQRPIPAAVYQNQKSLLDQAFVEYVDTALASDPGDTTTTN